MSPEKSIRIPGPLRGWRAFLVGMIIGQLVLWPILLIGALVQGCNHHDRDKAFPTQPSFRYGTWDVYLPVGTPTQDRLKARDAVAEAWLQFVLSQGYSLTPGIDDRRIYVHREKRLNGPHRVGVLGYWERDRIHVVAGDCFLPPDLYHQLVHTYLDPDPYHQDQPYWAKVWTDQGTLNAYLGSKWACGR